MNVTIPEDLTTVNRSAYLIGMQEFKTRCITTADDIMGTDDDPDFSKSNDLAKEFFYTFYDMADSAIRGAIEQISLYGLPTVKEIRQAARYSILVMERQMSLTTLLDIKKYDLIYA